jgi:hypothetical protein
MPRAGFEPMIPVFKRLKTVRALDRATIGTCRLAILLQNYCDFVNIYCKAPPLLTTPSWRGAQFKQEA